ncbi:MAG: spore photoproduct lyase family protein, partial [Pseudobdellovibrionaceae bacterium]
MISPELISQFEKIFIDEQSRSSELAIRVQKIFPADKIEFVSEAPIDHKGPLSAAQFNRSKKLLYIKPFNGHFFKRCPGASQKKVLTCCNYHVLNLGQQCNLNCSYCYLQSYLNTPTMQMYSNIDQALSELEEMAQLHPNSPFRVGTGEVIDSLSLDEISLFSCKLIAFFQKYPKWTLEFKTKSDKVDHFLDCEHSGNVVVSWSINAPRVIENEEHGTASFEARLAAARKCADRGFQVAFHIDPLIFHPNWQQGYEELVSAIHRNFKPSEVHVISVGALRFQPEQRHLMRERFGMKSWVTSAEMFPSEGNKLRYDQALRREMLDFVIQSFKSKDLAWRVFMCMETPESWISSYEKTPLQVPELKDLFR